MRVIINVKIWYKGQPLTFEAIEIRPVIYHGKPALVVMASNGIEMVLSMEEFISATVGLSNN